MTGNTRSSSSVTGTWGPGANGCPPMSTQSAPAAAADSTAAIAASSWKVAPRSWNESGVRLTIAITATRRAKSKLREPIVRRGWRSSGR